MRTLKTPVYGGALADRAPNRLAAYCALVNVQRRLLTTVGLQRRPRDVTPNHADYVAANTIEAVPSKGPLNAGNGPSRGRLRPPQATHDGLRHLTSNGGASSRQSLCF